MPNNTQIIALDAMGNDLGSQELILGLALAVKKYPNLCFLIFGQEKILSPILKEQKINPQIYDIIDCQNVITMNDNIRELLRNKKNSSMWEAIKAVHDKKADACVSLGNTGAQLLLGRKTLGMLPMIDKPALSTIWPNINQPVLFLDVGANVECNSEHLIQFALMGTAIYQNMFEKKYAKCAILNVGEEESKGYEELKKAAKILTQHKDLINYCGYCEGNDISLGSFEIVVTDGFSGNIALKTGEGAAKLVSHYLKQEIKATIRSKLAALLMKKELNAFKQRLSPSNYNGAIFAGLNGIMVKGHGSADADGTLGAINIAKQLINYNVNKTIIEFTHKLKQSKITQNLS